MKKKLFFFKYDKSPRFYDPLGSSHYIQSRRRVHFSVPRSSTYIFDYSNTRPFEVYNFMVNARVVSCLVTLGILFV